METVLATITDLESDVRAAISEACDEAGVSAEFLSVEEIVAQADSLTPSLLIAQLPEGQRSVPGPVAEIAGTIFPQLPVLLLCEESVTRGWHSTAAGALTMVGVPWNSAKLGSRIRATISRLPIYHPEQSLLPDLDDGRVKFLSREYRGKGFWAGTVLPVVDSPDVLRFQLSDDGFTGACSWHETRGLAAGVDLTVSSREWSFACAEHVSGFWLVSEGRIPATTDLTAGAQGRRETLQVPAAPGDLAVLLYGAEVPSSLSPANEEFAEALGNGGPSLLDLIATTCERQRLELSALIGELL